MTKSTTTTTTTTTTSTTSTTTSVATAATPASNNVTTASITTTTAVSVADLAQGGAEAAAAGEGDAGEQLEQKGGASSSGMIAGVTVAALLVLILAFGFALKRSRTGEAAAAEAAARAMPEPHGAGEDGTGNVVYATPSHDDLDGGQADDANSATAQRTAGQASRRCQYKQSGPTGHQCNNLKTRGDWCAKHACEHRGCVNQKSSRAKVCSSCEEAGKGADYLEPSTLQMQVYDKAKGVDYLQPSTLQMQVYDAASEVDENGIAAVSSSSSSGGGGRRADKLQGSVYLGFENANEESML